MKTERLIKLISETKSTDVKTIEWLEMIVNGMDGINIVNAEHDNDFMAYDYDNGERVPHGQPIGFEYRDENRTWECVLFANVHYSNTEYSDNELKMANDTDYQPRFLSWAKSYDDERNQLADLMRGEPNDVEQLKDEYQQLTGDEFAE